jgi:hypothetical protein
VSRANLRPYQLADLLEACEEMIDAYKSRAATATMLTLREQQAIAVLWIAMDDLREMEDAA